MHKCALPCGKAIEGRTHIVGECEMCKEERDVLGEMRKIGGCDMEEFGTLDSSEKVIAIGGDRWWPPTAKYEWDTISNKFVWQSLMSDRCWRCLFGVGTVLHLERDAWSMLE